ncbi:MAG TPA: MBL fold metallo-hydrolase [Ktedonobacterales bacterium]|jgi:glyoxylase-like metal-dependent hydrolase (beta-lactamase superfamily II)
MSIAATTLVSSKHFRLEQVAEGVYAALATVDGGAVCNAGIIDLGDHLLIFDTFLTPQAAVDLQAAAERLVGRSVTYVINSHWHSDHTNGNMIFAPDTPILATARTRELMTTYGRQEIDEDRQRLGAALEALEARIAQEPDESRRSSLSAKLAADREYAAALPTLEIRLPTQTFEDRLVLRGTRRSAELLTFGGGHSQSDALLWLPEDRLAFLGDLLFVNLQPWLPGGNPEEWLDILRRVEALDIANAVPGHGLIGTLADCAALRDHIAALLDMTREAIRSGQSWDEFKQHASLTRYSAWGNRSFFRRNLKFVYKRLAGQV